MEEGKTAAAVIGIRTTVPTTASSVHTVPCCIDHEGRAAVSSYFVPETNEKGELHAGFRGRQLQGTVVQLPKDVRGLVFRETARTVRSFGDDDFMDRDEEAETRQWVPDATFDSITTWKHDAPHLGEDPVARAMQWFDIADAVHAPVSAEDVEKQLASMK